MFSPWMLLLDASKDIVCMPHHRNVAYATKGEFMYFSIQFVII